MIWYRSIILCQLETKIQASKTVVLTSSSFTIHYYDRRVSTTLYFNPLRFADIHTYIREYVSLKFNT